MIPDLTSFSKLYKTLHHYNNKIKKNIKITKTIKRIMMMYTIKMIDIIKIVKIIIMNKLDIYWKYWTLIRSILDIYRTWAL